VVPPLRPGTEPDAPVEPVRITIYRWEGRWGPFRIQVPCGECALTGDIVQDTVEKELKGIPVVVESHPWLDHWWRPLLRGGWHAPIVLVDGRVISQGKALNRGLLTQAVMEAYARRLPIRGTVVFGKRNCDICHLACTQLETLGIPYTWLDVIEDPAALYEMLARVKPLLGKRTPVTVPQIWLNGRYLGGMDALDRLVLDALEPFLTEDRPEAEAPGCPARGDSAMPGC